MAHIVITRVESQAIPLDKRESALTIGEAIDAQLFREMASGARIQDVELHFTPDDWHDTREMIEADSRYRQRSDIAEDETRRAIKTRAK